MNSFSNDIKSLVIASFLFASPLVALGTFAAFNAPPANAGMSCSTNSYTGSTSCYGSGGSFNSTYNSYTGTSNYHGTDSNGNSFSGSCSTNSYTGTTNCY